LGKKCSQIIEDITKKLHIPIYNFPAGHIQDNRALILGSTAMEVTQLKASLTFIK
jgi:muramoyltetrapeptide carboxypeptidase